LLYRQIERRPFGLPTLEQAQFDNITSNEIGMLEIGHCAELEQPHLVFGKKQDAGNLQSEIDEDCRRRLGNKL
jgi:hypothetical protein